MKKLYYAALRFFSADSYRQRLVLEAVFYLFFSRCAISLVPFRHLSSLLDIRPQSVKLSSVDCQEPAENVGWAIASAARYLPFRLVCFPRGMAAYLMLRRRHVDTRIFYGIHANSDNFFAGHVWVKCGNINVIGCEEAEVCTVLMSYPQTFDSSYDLVSQK